MKLQQLRYFEAAGRQRSITRAAEELHVSQPSVSMAVQELEREFGLSLIRRKYQGFSLTEEGAFLLDQAQELLRHADSVSEHMSELGRRRRAVRLGMPPMIGAVVLPELCRALELRCPDLLVNIQELGAKALLQELVNDTLDLAFVSHSEPLPPELDSVGFSPMEIIWCARSDHPLASRESVTPGDLEYEPLVLFRDSLQLNERIPAWFASAGLTPRVRHTTGQLSTVETMIRSGTASGFLFRPTAGLGGAMAVCALSPAMRMEVSLAWNRRRRPFRDMERLIRLSRELPI